MGPVLEQLLWTIRRWWWLVGATALSLAAVGYGWASTQPEYYVAEGTYLVQPRTVDAADEVRALEALIASPGITSTFAEIAVSDLITDRAADALEADSSAEGRSRASVVGGTNILRIGARSRDAEAAHDLAMITGELTVAYVEELNDIFQLALLDPPRIPTTATGLGTVSFTTLGLFGGLALGIGAGLAAERRFPLPRRHRVKRLRDPRSTAYDKRYLTLRLSEEMTRSAEGESSFSVGVLRVLRPGVTAQEDTPALLAEEDLAAVTECIQSTLRGHDVLGHLGKGRFAAILPDMGIDEANELVRRWQADVNTLLIARPLTGDVAVSVGASSYDGTSFVGDPEAERVALAR